MANKAKPFYFAAAPLITIGAVFAAVGAAGQAAFGYTAVGFLVPGVVLLVTGYRQR